jgi:hypothetical protein
LAGTTLILLPATPAKCVFSTARVDGGWPPRH